MEVAVEVEVLVKSERAWGGGNLPKSALGKGVLSRAQGLHDVGHLVRREADVGEDGEEDVLVDALVPLHHLTGHFEADLVGGVFKGRVC